MRQLPRPSSRLCCVLLSAALCIGVRVPTAVAADDGKTTDTAKEEGGESKVGSFFKKFVDDVKANVKASNPGLGTSPASPGPGQGTAAAPAVELPTATDATAFGKTMIAGLRIGMSEEEAINAVRKHNPVLVMTPYWLSTSMLTEQKLRGAVGIPKPSKPDGNWDRGAPYIKVGIEFTNPGNFGGECLQGLTFGVPDVPAEKRNQTCERIWLQVTPEASGNARVVAISRTLIFGGNTQPPIEALSKDIEAKYGKPSSVARTYATSRGEIPVLMVWAFDNAGALVSQTQASPLGERITGWDSPPRGYAGSGLDGRITVIGGDEGPEFTRTIHVGNNPRQLTVNIMPSGTAPLLAGRLHVNLMDPGGVLKNHQLRIAEANRLIAEHNARIDKAQQEVAEQAAGNKPVL